MVHFPHNKIPNLHPLPRMRVVEAAREFVGLPHVHLGRSKKRGVDCLGLLCCVADLLGVSDFMPGYKYRAYTEKGYDVLSHPDSLVSLLEEPLSRIENIEDRGLGDIEVYWIRHKMVPCHTAILTDKGHLHCVQGKKVVEQPRSGFWDKRLVAAYRFPGVEE